MKKMVNLKLVSAFVCVCRFSSSLVFAQSFSMSPGADGSLNVDAAAEWTYAPNITGSARLWTDNSAVVEDKDMGSFDYSGTALAMDGDITTVRRQISVETVPVRYTAGPAVFGLSVQADYQNISEVGLVEFYQNGITDPAFNLFFNNQRIITTVKPGVLAGVRLSTDALDVSLQASYAPWMYMGLDQEFASASEATIFDTDKTPNAYHGSSYHAWSALVSAALRISGFNIHLENAWEGMLLDYEFVGFGGAITRDTSWEISTRAEVSLSWDKIAVNGWIPQIGAGYQWRGIYDQIDTAAAPRITDAFRFVIGFRGK